MSACGARLTSMEIPPVNAVLPLLHNLCCQLRFRCFLGWVGRNELENMVIPHADQVRSATLVLGFAGFGKSLLNCPELSSRVI
jgi:hypothetical protein